MKWGTPSQYIFSLQSARRPHVLHDPHRKFVFTVLCRVVRLRASVHIMFAGTSYATLAKDGQWVAAVHLILGSDWGADTSIAFRHERARR